MSYDLARIPELESEVEKQARRLARRRLVASPLSHASPLQASGASPYALRPLLDLLLLYTVAPARASPQSVASCLLLSLAQLPRPDFTHVTHLIPSSTSSDPGVLALCGLAGHLEAGRFASFWSGVAPADRGYAPAPSVAKPHVAAARGFVATQLSATYTRCPLPYALTCLCFDTEAELSVWIASSGQAEGWRVDAAAGLVVMPPTAGNAPREATSEAISFTKLSGLFPPGVVV